MLVSIIVPFYNVEPYFRRCLDSIVNQSYQELEIILVNDCSPDRSIDIAREYASKDSRIRIIEHEKSLHVGGARNSGLAVATGEYIWFIDSDDEIATPYAVDHLVSVAKRDNSDIILFRAQKKSQDHRQMDIVSDFLYHQEHLFDQQVGLWSNYLDSILHYKNTTLSTDHEVWIKFFKSSFLSKYNFVFLEHTIHQDLPVIMLLPLARRLTQLPYTFYCYYSREESTMNSTIVPHYIEHFNRIASELWRIYDSYWGDWSSEELVIPTLLMLHTLRNTHRIEYSLPKQEYEQWLVDVYDFLERELASRENFLQMTPWPEILSNQKGWRKLLMSFGNSLGRSKKIALMHAIMTRKRLSIKNLGKSLLPFTVVKHMLEQRGWEVCIEKKKF